MKTKVQELPSNEIVLLAAILTVVVTITSANGDFDWWDTVVGIIALGFLWTFCQPDSTSVWAIGIYNLAVALCSIVIIAFPLYLGFAIYNLPTFYDRCILNDNKHPDCLFDTTRLNLTLMIVFVVVLGLLFLMQRRQKKPPLLQQSSFPSQPAINALHTTSSSSPTVQSPPSNPPFPAKTSIRQVTAVTVMAVALAVFLSIILGRQSRH